MTWAQMDFDHEKHHRTSILLISASEEVIETLEDNQVCDYPMCAGEKMYRCAMSNYSTLL